MESNKLIAEFMGVPCDKDLYTPLCPYTGETLFIPSSQMKYDTSWDWLMPVVEKIESLGYWVNRNDGDITISNKSDMVVVTPMSSGGIDMMYKAVVEFIKEYNDEQ